MVYPPVERAHDRDHGYGISILSDEMRRKGKLVQMVRKSINGKRKHVETTPADACEVTKPAKILYAHYVCLLCLCLVEFCAHKFPAKTETRKAEKHILEYTSYIRPIILLVV